MPYKILCLLASVCLCLSHNLWANIEESVDKAAAETLREVPQYTVQLLKPENQSFFTHDVQEIPVEISITPEPQDLLKVRLYVDEVLVSEDMKSTTLAPLERGEHVIRVELLDKNGALLSTAQSTVYQYRASVY